MKALLLKDWYVLRKQVWSYLCLLYTSDAADE